MSIKKFLSDLGADLARHTSPEMSAVAKIQELVASQGVWATVMFRYGQWAYSGGPAPLKLPAKLAYKVGQKAVEVATGISMPASVKAGPGFYIGHFGAIIIHPDSQFGDNCSIGQGVTLGTRGQGDGGVPVLGDNVYVGAGAKVLGGVRLGDNVAVGANAVVVKDVPADHVAVGVPAAIKPRKRG